MIESKYYGPSLLMSIIENDPGNIFMMLPCSWCQTSRNLDWWPHSMHLICHSFKDKTVLFVSVSESQSKLIYPCFMHYLIKFLNVRILVKHILKRREKLRDLNSSIVITCPSIFSLEEFGAMYGPFLSLWFSNGLKALLQAPSSNLSTILF